MTRSRIDLVFVTIAGVLVVCAGASMRAHAGGKQSGEVAYPAEEASKDTDYVGCGYFTKGFCQNQAPGGWGAMELNEGASEGEIVPSCKFPAPNAGKWAKLSARARSELAGDMRPGDVVFIPASSTWGEATCGDDECRCVDVRWYSKKHHFDKNKCGELGDTTVCEASGSKTARGINMLHFRVDEARKAQSAGDNDTCQAAAGAAIAISRGLPKFKQSLVDSGDWAKGLTYHTRYDGKLSEAAAFEKAAKLGTEAAALFKKCGGTKVPSGDDAELVFTKDR